MTYEQLYMLAMADQSYTDWKKEITEHYPDAEWIHLEQAQALANAAAELYDMDDPRYKGRVLELARNHYNNHARHWPKAKHHIQKFAQSERAKQLLHLADCYVKAMTLPAAWDLMKLKESFDMHNANPSAKRLSALLDVATSIIGAIQDVLHLDADQFLFLLEAVDRLDTAFETIHENYTWGVRNKDQTTWYPNHYAAREAYDQLVGISKRRRYGAFLHNHIEMVYHKSNQ